MSSNGITCVGLDAHKKSIQVMYEFLCQEEEGGTSDEVEPTTSRRYPHAETSPDAPSNTPRP